MAFLEIELRDGKFNDFVKFIAAGAPIPIPVTNALGPTRLIADFTWNDVAIGALPAGFTAPDGTLGARCNVTIKHVSTAELDANPNAPGSTTGAVAWILMRATPFVLRLELFAIDIGNAPRQWFTPAVEVAVRPVPSLGGPAPAAAAFLMRDDVVTLRFATQAADNIRTSTLNMIATTGDDWAIRLSGEFFVEQLLAKLQDAVKKLPGGTSLEDSPSASWGQSGGTFAAIGSMGVVKEDACPGLFGDVDISVTIDVTLTPSANIAPSPPQLVLTLQLNSDASDWDSFRCWLGNGGILSSLLGIVATPLIGPGAAGLLFLTGSIASGIAVSETVRLDAGKEVKDNGPSGGFTLVNSSDTSATYTNQMNLPTLLTTLANGSTNGALQTPQVGPFGMLISGSMFILAPVHQRSFQPDGGTLSTAMHNAYSCKTHQWRHVVDVQSVEVTDTASLLGRPIGKIPVTLFETTTVTPASEWAVDPEAPDIDLFVTVKNTDPQAKTGDTGRLYLHTSAGIRRYDLAALPALAAPTDLENAAAVAACWKDERYFLPWEEIRWLVDPPPGETVFDPLRQWLFTFAELPEGTRIEIEGVDQRETRQQLGVFETSRAGEAFVELLTDAKTELSLRHNKERLDRVRLTQRWLMPLRTIELGEPGLRLTRSGALVVVEQRSGIVVYDLETGQSRRQAGEFQVSKLPSGGFELLQQTRQRLGAAASESTRAAAIGRDRTPDMPPSCSVSLPGGKVAALFGTRLLIAAATQAGGDIAHHR